MGGRSGRASGGLGHPRRPEGLGLRRPRFRRGRSREWAEASGWVGAHVSVDLDLVDVRGERRVFRHGGEFAFTEELEANTGKLIDIVAHVADTLAACGEALRAGEVIIPGSVTPPIFLDADDADVRFELEPAGSVSVRLR